MPARRRSKAIGRAWGALFAPEGDNPSPVTEDALPKDGSYFIMLHARA